MTPQLQQFYTNWLGKADSYQGDSLANHFDKFISLYVVFNSLYMEIMSELVNSGVNITRNFRDKVAATDYVIKYLKSRFFINTLLNDQASNDSLNVICDIIQAERFHIILDWGNFRRDLDLDLLGFLQSSSKQEKAKGILSLFYNIRCNLFHGHKSFENRQRQLLTPVNHLLRKTIVIVFNKMNS